MAVVVSLFLARDGQPNIGTWYTLGAVAFVLTGLVSVLDRDGWRVRDAMAWIALNQRHRWPKGDMPEGAREAIAWLDAPENAEAWLARAGLLIGLGRWDEATAILDEFSPTDAQEAASRIRMRSMLDARSADRIDQAPLRAAVRTLPLDEARYQLAASAWSQAWLDLTAGRPWRREFARATRDLGPFPLPARIRAWLAAEQLLAPIACVLGTIIATVFSAFD